MSPDLLEHVFAERFKQIACSNQEVAKRFISFALQCVQGTPTDAGLTPAALVAGVPLLKQTIASVGEWLAGHSFSPEQDAVQAAAAKEGGDFQSRATGRKAACWSVYHLNETVGTVLEARNDADHLNDVAMHAGMVSYLTRHASEGGMTLAAVQYQEQLMKRVLVA